MNIPPPNMPFPGEEAFREMCKAHDLTHVYSDDHAVWRRGSVQLNAIRNAAAHLPRDVAVRIWNEEVDRKLVPGARAEFYWPA